MSKLALLGGSPTVEGEFKLFKSVGQEERDAVCEVIDSGLLSGFYGSWCDEFWGGPKIRKLEELWAETFGCKHAVSINSNTSGLISCMGAIGVSAGDEVIVPPYTMSATVVAPLYYGGVPVFADIDENDFCIDPAHVEQLITNKTKAIIAVNLFGQPAKLKKLRALADRHNIYLIEDNAQAPTASEYGKFTGTIGHVGVFSLNCHKHIQTGEGGICTTDDDDLALRLQMIRNHGENVVRDTKVEDLTNLVGQNYRMTELSAAVGIEQLKKADQLISPRVELAEYLNQNLSGLDGLITPPTRDGCRHVYYVWAMRVDQEQLGISRDTFVKALAAEGVFLSKGYLEPLYKLPVFQERKAFGRDAYPFSITDRHYEDVGCPVVERLQNEEVVTFEICAYAYSDTQKAQIIEAVHKVHSQRHELQGMDETSS
ncbi:DegT/DnrJ/EryC1/StrS family aminotransferase [Magnetovibrio sp. PR-2]|uniref:DegT/DnrJ/EryC1/StrS family aminotransferase n=1 Tax=Magnetovibrio sp. PR-2 TaxID=3120356 RepID=UPI002FCE44BF